MNTRTGDIYEGEEQIKAALARGEPVVEVSEKVAQLVKDGELYQLQKAKRRARERPPATHGHGTGEPRGGHVNAEEIAKVVANYLDDRDDIAQAFVSPSEEGPTVQVITQGGGQFELSVAPV